MRVPKPEPAAQAFVEATANPPYLFDLGPIQGRKTVDEAQAGEIAKPDVDEEWVTVPVGSSGEVNVRIVKPVAAGTKARAGTLPVIRYIHGAGWVFGNTHTHDRLVRELASEPTPRWSSPSTACLRGDIPDWDRRELRRDWLRRDAMQWFWDQYTTSEKERAEITPSPLRASLKQLAGLPALIINAEADVLRDEGEAYAARLRTAGVAVTAVRFSGIIYDFLMLNTLRGTQAAEAAIAQAVATLKDTLAAR